MNDFAKNAKAEEIEGLIRGIGIVSFMLGVDKLVIDIWEIMELMLAKKCHICIFIFFEEKKLVK
jgi:hypothetical protein